MTPHEMDDMVSRIHALLDAERKAFWVDPEKHYNDHQSLHEMIQEWKSIKGAFVKAFVGFAIVGAIVMAGVGSVTKLFGK